jgi:lysophospholipase L1-like esterase
MKLLLPLQRILFCMLFLCIAGARAQTASRTKYMTTSTIPFKWLALGDSYTIGTSVSSDQTYAAQTSALLGQQGYQSNLHIIATNGWTTADLLKGVDAGTAPDEKFDIVTLLIGVNNQYQGRSMDEYRAQFKALLAKAIALAGGRPGRVIVLSIPDYSVTPFVRDRDTKKIASEIDAFNATNKLLAEEYHAGYLDVTTSSRQAATDPNLIASDQLHFSGKAYAQWSAMLAPRILAALQR